MRTGDEGHERQVRPCGGGRDDLPARLPVERLPGGYVAEATFCDETT